MRRIRKWVMILALCLAVTGCGVQENDEQKEETESAKQTVMQTEQGDNEAGAVQSKPQKSSVDTPQSVDKAFAYINADGQLCLWQQGSQVPVVLAEHWLSADNTALLMGYTKEELESMLSSVELEGIKKIVYTKDRQGIYFPSNFLFYPLGSTELRPTYELGYFGEGESRSRVAESVFAHMVDQEGNLWYSVLQITAAGRQASLYRYDGVNHQLIGNLGRFSAGSWQTAENGNLAVFVGEDERLYAWSREGGLREEALTELVQEQFYLAADGESIICQNGSQVQVILLDEVWDIRVDILKEEWDEVYILGEASEYLLVMNQRQVLYEELLFNDALEDEDSNRVWEIMRKTGPESGIFRCEVGMYDVKRGEYVAYETGFSLESLEYEQMEPITGYFFLEMIADKKFQKLPLSEYLAPDTVGEIAEAYESVGQDVLYGISDKAPFYALARGYIAGNGLWKVCEGMEFSDQVEVRKNYSSQTGDFYVKIIRYLNTEDYELIHVGEDTYEINKEGSCKKVVEAAGQARIIGDQLYYTRIVGTNGIQRLFTLEEEGVILEAESISMDSMKKSLDTGRLYYLTGSYGMYDSRSGDLWVFDGQETMMLEEGVFSFMLYGDDSIAAIQKNIKMLLGEEQYRLVVIEQEESKIVDEHVVDIIRIQ